MKKQQQRVRGGRRTFFRNVAGLGVAAGTGALILRNGPAPQPQKAQAKVASGAGYRETDHIRKYYETARG